MLLLGDDHASDTTQEWRSLITTKKRTKVTIIRHCFYLFDIFCGRRRVNYIEINYHLIYGLLSPHSTTEDKDMVNGCDDSTTTRD